MASLASMAMPTLPPPTLQRMHVVEAPLAADHDRQPRGEGRRVVQRALHVAAVGAVEQFEVAIDRIRDAGGFGRPRIGGIGVAETALGALGPDRPGRRGGETAQHFGFFQQRLVPEVGFGEFPAQSAEFANPHNGLAADGAAHGLEGVSVRGGEIEQKALAGLAQRIDRMIHLQRRLRRQPGSEGENALRLDCWESGGINSEMSPLICGRLSPAAQEIRICGSANSSARNRSASICRPWMSERSRASLLAARTRVRISRIAATTEKPSSASAVVSTAISWRLRSKKVEIAAGQRQIAGIGRCDRGQRGGAKGDQAVARQ